MAKNLRTPKIPKYCKRPDADAGFFWHNRKKIYLPGKFNSEISISAYHKAIAEIAVAKSTGNIVVVTKKESVTIAMLVDRFFKWADTYYVKNGKKTETCDNMFYATIPLTDLYAGERADDFTPNKLRVVQQKILESGICRNEVNRKVSQIKRIFKWGVSYEMVSEQGVPITVVQQAMRHADLRMTMRYTHTKLESVSDGVSKLPDYLKNDDEDDNQAGTVAPC